MAVTAEYVASRAVGAAMGTAIFDGSGRSSILGPPLVPREVWRREVDADEQDEVVLGYNVAHVRLGAAAILLDLGFDESSPTSPWRAPGGDHPRADHPRPRRPRRGRRGRAGGGCRATPTRPISWAVPTGRGVPSATSPLRSWRGCAGRLLHPA